jgi:hypothetical protein
MSPEEVVPASELALLELVDDAPPGMSTVCAVCGEELPQEDADDTCYLTCPDCWLELPLSSRLQWNRAVERLDYEAAVRTWRVVAA